MIILEKHLRNVISPFFCSPELEKGLKKRVKLHTHENGENGQNGQNGQNGEIDSDDNYTEVKWCSCDGIRKHLKPNKKEQRKV